MKLVLIFACVLAALPSLDAQTYYKEVSRIFRDRCESCHRDGDIAPFALKDHETAVTWGEDIKRVLTQGTMPPWKAVAGHGEFRDNRSISEDDKNTVLAWIEAGMPAGDEADKLEPLSITSDWALGYPDEVLTMRESYTPARGKDDYRCFVIPTDWNEDRYLSALDFHPGDRALVHHIILYLDTQNVADALDEKDADPGYECFGGPGTDFNITSISSLFSAGRSMAGGWAPGQRASHLPEGVGIEIPKGAKLIMQIHYFPLARTGPDQTSVGFYFTKEKPQRRLYHIPVLNTSFKIPPGAESHDVVAQIPAILDAKVIAIYPHMHLLGRQIKVEYEEGLLNPKKTPLIYIDNWDFNWQGYYTYVQPVQLNMSLFNRIKATCTFDNSENNPKNPNNPLKQVGWGEGTQDEMCIAFLAVTLDQESLVAPFSSRVPVPSITDQK